MLPPKQFKTVKQPAGSRCCSAAVAAMAVGESLKYVLDYVADIRHEDGQRYLRTRDLLGFLGNHGVHTGEVFMVPEDSDGISVDPSMYCEQKTPFRNRPAILSVPSKVFVGKFHHIFWDGHVVRDPSPLVGDKTRLEDYRVIDIIFLVYVDEDLEKVEVE